MTLTKIFHIPLHNAQGQFAVVDFEDYGLVSTQTWSMVRRRDKLYAYTRINKRFVYMHRFIMGNPCGKLVDHEDGNGLNNRRGNLRACTRSQNGANQRPHRDRRGKYKGVYLEKTSGRYVAQICLYRKRRKIGRYETAIEAARAYDVEAVKTWGEFAKVNGVWTK